MSVTTQHPDYTKFAPRWDEMDDALDEQDTIHAKGEKYLPKTSGMIGAEGDKRYETYKKRARFPGIVRQTLTGIVGLMFEKDPYGSSEDDLPVTPDGLTPTQLARDVARAVGSYGRSLLLVDAPEGDGGVPYIARYHPKSLINWKIDDDTGLFSLAVLMEDWEKEGNDEFSHETEKRYRVYRKTGDGVTVEVREEGDEIIEPERVLPGLNVIPLIAIGSISVDPGVDPVPLLPVKDCAVAAYQIGADLRQDLYESGQRMYYMIGGTEEQYKANTNTGTGNGVCWWGPEGTEFGLVESNGNNYKDASAERQHEIETAATYAVKLVQNNDRAESGRAMQIRASAQHASIYTMADSISQGMQAALALRAKWAGEQADPEKFMLRTEFSNQEAAEQMITALNNAVSAMNLPVSVLFEAVRRAGLTDMSDDELRMEIENEGGLSRFSEPEPIEPAANDEPVADAG